jgi:endonuclease/exonuclease/phosphatase family metal-dependent hydrolase
MPLAIRFRRRTAIAICLGLVPACCGSAFAGTTSLNVMSFNVRYANDFGTIFGPNGWSALPNPRRALVVQSIQNFAPDLLGVQEPYLTQVDYLRQQLPEYGFAGVGRNDGITAGEYCGIFYRQDRFTLVESGSFWLSATPSVPGTSFVSGGVPRIATWAKLDDLASGQQYFLLNTHWDNVSSSARLQSAALIRDQIPLLAGDLPVLLLGDFNTSQSTSPYNEIRGLNTPSEFQLLDSYRQVHPTTSSNERTFHDFQGGTSGSRIDFILHSDDFAPTAATIDRTQYGALWPSDHYPVTATFNVMIVPEPSTAVLLVIGAAMIALARKRFHAAG